MLLGFFMVVPITILLPLVAMVVLGVADGVAMVLLLGFCYVCS